MFKLGHQRWRDNLSAYIDNRLDEPERGELEHHLVGCRPCREELAALRATVEALRHLPPVAPSRSFALSREVATPVPQWFGALRLATAVAAFFLVVLISLDLASLAYPAATMKAVSEPAEPVARSYGQDLEAEKAPQERVGVPAAPAPPVVQTPTPALAAQKAVGEAAPMATQEAAPALAPTATPLQAPAEKTHADVIQEEVSQVPSRMPFSILDLVKAGLLMITLALLALTLWRGRLERRF